MHRGLILVQKTSKQTNKQQQTKRFYGVVTGLVNTNRVPSADLTVDYAFAVTRLGKGFTRSKSLPLSLSLHYIEEVHKKG